MSIGEILKVGAIDTVLGMGTVFCILIFIAFCIWLMGKACAPRKAADAVQAAEAPKAEAVPVSAAYNYSSDNTAYRRRTRRSRS